MNRAVASLLFTVLMPVAIVAQSSPAAAPAPASAEKSTLPGVPASDRETTSASPAWQVPAQHRIQAVAGLIKTGGCPVSMRAQPRGGLSVVEVGKGSSSTPSQELRINFATWGFGSPQFHAEGIVSARVTVKGYTSVQKVLPVAVDGADASLISKTFDLGLMGVGGRNVSSRLVLESFAVVSQVRLESMTFADGSTWTPGLGRRCTVAPDHFLLVGGL